MTVKTFPGKSGGENTYIYYDETTKDAVIIDPGDGAAKAAAWCAGQPLTPRAALLTHGHFDHICGLSAFPGVPIHALSAEAALLADPIQNYSEGSWPAKLSVTAAVQLEHNAPIPCGSFALRALHTPGHTSGGCCYHDEAHGVLFSGDTLFFHSVGRADLYTGSPEDLEQSIRTVLYKLPSDTKVYPGHGARTTIAEEKLENPYVSEVR